MRDMEELHVIWSTVLLITVIHHGRVIITA